MLRAGALILLLVSAAWAQRGVQRNANPLGTSPEIAAAGRVLYNQNCTNCHGLDATAGDRAPALAAQRSYNRTSDQDLFDAVTKGIPGTGMPPVGLSADDSWRIVAYIRSLRASAADFPPDGDVAQGEAIYNGKGQCGACHTIAGRGGLIGPDLTNLGARSTVGRIREALTVAKPHPPAGYRPVTVQLKDGSTVRGVLKNENNFSFQILGTDDRLHLLSSDEIERLDRDAASLMPSDYDKRLTAEELTNLIAYLSRLVR
jgi:putative heme-binding domain-containing protein